MLNFLLGLQKYFIAALVGLVLTLAASSWYYRASYYSESAARQTVETALEQTNLALQQAIRAHTAQVEALTQSAAEASRLNTQLRISRERILNAPSSQDGPVAPILRCAVTGVCP